MKRGAAIILIFAAAVCVGALSASAAWLIPLVTKVDFEYETQTPSQVAVNFVVNTSEPGYGGLAQPQTYIPYEQLSSPTLPDDGVTVYDDDPERRLYFAGWYTSSEGGERVDENYDLAPLVQNGEITLYARWGEKAVLNVTLNDLSAVYDINFILLSGTNQAEINSAYVQSAVYYLNPEGAWSITVSAGSQTVQITSSQNAVTAGGVYYYSALVRNAIINLPSQFTQ